MDTIFALATAQGRAGVAVVRISGNLAFQAGGNLAGELPKGAGRSLRLLRSSEGEVLDQALVLTFPHGSSFTGEDVVELHLHGSRAVVAAVLHELSGQSGLRLAEPGEFTRRALENECLDLAQIEGLGDLIDAETEGQRRQAMRVLSGNLGKIVEVWRQKLIRAAALLEATIDFADEEVPVDVTPEVSDLLAQVSAELETEIAGSHVAEKIRDGFEVAIVGAPNIGKSTLLNALAGREAAITSDVAGTTRDVIEVTMDLRGLPVTFLDTAGLRETEDQVEQIGVARAKERALAADLRIFLVSEEGEQPDLPVDGDDLVLVGKSDLSSGCCGVSGKTGEGVADLVDAVSDVLGTRAQGVGIATKERHRVAMLQAQDDISAAIGGLAHGPDLYEIVAEDLRRSILALDSLVGRVDVEHILDEIFSSFCLGK